MLHFQWQDLAIDADGEVSVVSDNARSHQTPRPAKRGFRRCASLPEKNRCRLPPRRTRRRSSIDLANDNNNNNNKSSSTSILDDTICRWTKISISASKDLPPKSVKRRLGGPAITLSNANFKASSSNGSCWQRGSKEDSIMTDKTSSTTTRMTSSSALPTTTTATPLSLIKQVLDSMDDSQQNCFHSDHGDPIGSVATKEDNDTASLTSVEMI